MNYKKSCKFITCYIFKSVSIINNVTNNLTVAVVNIVENTKRSLYIVII